jgi:hypothetical protein
MLTIIFESGKGRDWHIGEKNPVEYAEAIAIAEIQLDGDELEYVINKFRNLVIPSHKRVVRYFGDVAKLIVVNL